MVIQALIRSAFSTLRNKHPVVETTRRQDPPSVVNERLYRMPPPGTPLDVVPNTRDGIRQLSTFIGNFTKQVATEAWTKETYASKVQNELAEIRKLTFWDDIGILCRRLIDFRAYAGIKAWEDLKNSSSKLFILNEPESIFHDMFEPKYPDIHIVYLLDEIAKRKPIPKESPINEYLNNWSEGAIERCNHELHSAFLKALDFLQVKSIAPLCYSGVVMPGFVVADTEGSSMSTGGYLGIEIDYKAVEDLISAIKEGSDEKIASHTKALESAFVHTLTHSLQNTPDKDRDSSSGVNGNKIAPYAVKFLYDAINDYDIDPSFVLSFDFAQSKGIKETILAMKSLYNELCKNEQVQALCGKPQNFNPATLADTIKKLKSSDEGIEIMEALVQKMLAPLPNDLLEITAKIPDPEVKTIESIPYENGTIEVVSDGFLVSNAIVTLSTSDDGGNVTRSIRLNETVVAALSDEKNDNYASARKILDFAIAQAKKPPVNVLKNDSTKIDILEYAARKIQEKLGSELEVSLKPNNTLQGLKGRIDLMMSGNKFDKVFNLAKSIRMLTSLDETLVCWDYESKPHVQRTYIA